MQDKNDEKSTVEMANDHIKIHDPGKLYCYSDGGGRVWIAFTDHTNKD